MKTILASRAFGAIAAAAIAVGAIGAAGAARADVLFHNTTGRTVYFSVSCNGNGTDQWSIAPYADRSIVCNNGADAMRVYILTDDHRGEVTVKATAWDGRSYNLGYDGEGDMSIALRG